jgi:hypothetical protein
VFDTFSLSCLTPQIADGLFIYWAIMKIIQIRLDVTKLKSINISIVSLAALIFSLTGHHHRPPLPLHSQSPAQPLYIFRLIRLASLVQTFLPRRELTYALEITETHTAVLTTMYVTREASNFLAGLLVLVYWYASHSLCLLVRTR